MEELDRQYGVILNAQSTAFLIMVGTVGTTLVFVKWPWLIEKLMLAINGLAVLAWVLMMVQGWSFLHAHPGLRMWRKERRAKAKRSR